MIASGAYMLLVLTETKILNDRFVLLTALKVVTALLRYRKSLVLTESSLLQLLFGVNYLNFENTISATERIGAIYRRRSQSASGIEKIYYVCRMYSDRTHTQRHATSFGLLRAVLKRGLVVPDIYALVPYID